MKLPDFELERYFARWEFVAPYNLCASDVQALGLGDLLKLADDEAAALWRDLTLGYTESAGHPLLRAEIAALYRGVGPDQVLTFAGAEEAIFVLLNALLDRGDHAVVAWPGYQSLYEVARAALADVTLWPLEQRRGWAPDLDALRRLLRPATRLIVVNFPHNPTGALPDRDTFEGLLALTEEAGAYLFSDEAYRFLEYDPADCLPAAVECSDRAISLGVLSKAFGLAGLRVGWVAARDADLLRRAAAFKDYTSICSSAPSEILALIALRARKALLARSGAILQKNLAQLDRFFADRPAVLEWVRPRAGSVAFPRLVADEPIERFVSELVGQEGVLLLPGTAYGHPDNHFRIGFGRTDLSEGLSRLARFTDHRFGRVI